MAIRPEMRGGITPPVSLAAVAVVASLAGKSLHNHNQPNHVKFVPEAERHEISQESETAGPAWGRERIIKIMRGVHHSPTHHLTPAQLAVRAVTPAEVAAWSKVNICEEGGRWHVSGSKYSGGLGISNTNWVIYGGESLFHTPTAANATPKEQIVIAMRIQKNPPDQNGCSGSW